jgi:two-component system CheB/CheR fusion protein
MKVEERPARGADAKDEEIKVLETELKAAKEYLQSTIEELQTSNEELKSTNEEVQSTNEELETSREELQSANEELVTVNTELQNKVDELSLTTNDLNNLLASTDVATIFLDSNLRIKRYTPTAVRIFHLLPTDVGRPITDITSRVASFDIYKAAGEVQQTLIRQTRDVQIENDRWYSIRVMPYRTIENNIEGVVLTFIDITDLKEAMIRTENSAVELLKNSVGWVKYPSLFMDGDLRVIFANREFFDLFGMDPGEIIDRNIDEIPDEQWRVPELRKDMERTVRKGPISNYIIEHEFPRIGRRKITLNSRQLGENTYVLVTVDKVG